MEYNDFCTILKKYLEKIEVETDNIKIKKLYDYMNFLLEWNQKINLTAIKEPKDIIVKHFIDSLSINKYIKKTSKVIDIGTGAGFPGIPNAIYSEKTEITLVDSLNKRINFLDKGIEYIKLNNVKTICERAENIGQNKLYREKFDIATSRAVAPLNILIEYLLPLVKVNGYCICMKGPNCEEELEQSQKAIVTLGGKIKKVENIELDENTSRTLIIIEKINKTDKNYPRRAGVPTKKPLI